MSTSIPTARSTLSRFQIGDCVSGLRVVFVGMLLAVFPFTINGTDLLDNTLGMILIVVGVHRIRRLPVVGLFKSSMDFAFYVAWVGVLHSILNRMDMRWEMPFPLVLELAGLAYPIAIWAFCNGIRDFCRQNKLSRSAESWWVTSLLAGLIYLLPLLLLRLTAIASLFSNRRAYAWNVRGDMVYLLLIAMAVPLVHFFISTSRMKREGVWGMQP